MDCEFYNYTSPPAGARRLVVPVQRLLRRVLRPMFQRLRDLLRHLYDLRQEDAARVAELTHRVAALEAAVHQLAASRRALALDHLALTRRVGQLEDLLLQALAARPEPQADPLDGLLPLDGVAHTGQPLRKAS
jgi:hypothetical protein